MKDEKTLVILSGGQDSTTCLFWALREYKEVHAITFDYGQRHCAEINAALEIGGMAKVHSHELMECDGILKSTSPLLSDNELEQYVNYEQMDKVIGNRTELTFVPLRNPFFLLVAANHAIHLGCKSIVTGVCESDNANYPDCREKFIQAMQQMIDSALGARQIEIVTPLLQLNKKEICTMAYAMPDCWEALAYSHTSYDGKYPPTDMNHANVLRAQGFLEAGLPDPLVLEAVKEGLMELPVSDNYKGYL
jgi:7-cyano-7-deazaguanine synthase